MTIVSFISHTHIPMKLVTNHRHEAAHHGDIRANAKKIQHEEKENGVDLWKRLKFGNCIGIRDERETSPTINHTLNVGLAELMSQISQYSKNAASSEQRSEGIECCHDIRISVDIVAKFVVR